MEKLTVKKTARTKRLLSAVLAAALAAILFPAETQMIQAGDAVALAAPRIDTSDEAAKINSKSKQKVTWDCVWFGSYPQAEVVSEEIYENYEAILDLGFYNAEKDLVVSDRIYHALQDTSAWIGDDVTLNGVKYRRIRKEDAEHVATGSYYYNWPDDGSYHYFKYEPIKWRVLSVSDGQALLLADKTLDLRAYHYVFADVTWENSTIRSWMNAYDASCNQQEIDYGSQQNFLYSAFNVSEQSAIMDTEVANLNNIYYGTAGGNDTSDQIFLLSESEVYDTDQAASYGFTKSGSFDEARICTSSIYAKAMGICSFQSTISSYAGANTWWLRSPGSRRGDQTNVLNNGCVSPSSYNYYIYGVRPALNLKLSDVGQYRYAGTVSSDGTIDEMAYQIYDAQDKMGGLPTAENLKPEHEAAIDAAREAYSFLTDAQKAQITDIDELYAKLVAAETKRDEIKQSLSEIQAQLEALPEVWRIRLESETAIRAARDAYQALTPDQKEWITTLERLTSAEGRLSELRQQIIKVQEQIDAVASGLGNMTVESEPAVNELKQAYAELTEEQKEFITGYEDTLQAAEERLEELKKENVKPDNGSGGTDGTDGTDSSGGTDGTNSSGGIDGTDSSGGLQGSDSSGGSQGSDGSGGLQDSDSSGISKDSQSSSSDGKTAKVSVKKVTIKSAKKMKTGKVLVKWKKNSSVSGYQIRYSTSKTFKKNVKKIKISKKTKTSQTITKLKKKKTYYFQVCAYKKVNGKIYCSAWSVKKKVKMGK